STFYVLGSAQRRTSHAERPSTSSPLLSKRHPQLLEQYTRAVIASGRRDDGDVQAFGLVRPRVIDLRKDEVVPDAQRVIASSVERLGRNASEVAYTRQRDIDEPVQELVHPVAPERDPRADRHPGPQLVGRDGLLGFRDHGLLPGDRRELLGRPLQDFWIGNGLPQ